MEEEGRAGSSGVGLSSCAQPHTNNPHLCSARSLTLSLSESAALGTRTRSGLRGRASRSQPDCAMKLFALVLVCLASASAFVAAPAGGMLAVRPAVAATPVDVTMGTMVKAKQRAAKSATRKVVVQRDDDLLTPQQVQEHWKEVQAARLKELNMARTQVLQP